MSNLNVCHWEGYVFCPCSKFDGSLYNAGVFRCRHCDSPIRRPDPEVFLKVSGKTFVVECKGSEYLITDPRAVFPVIYNFDFTVFNVVLDKGYVKLFKENDRRTDDLGDPYLKITDDIAKLRPIVTVAGRKENSVLYGINEGGDFLLVGETSNYCYWKKAADSDDIEIASISNLEE